MKRYFYALICSMLFCSLTQSVLAQGCVAVRNMSSCAMNLNEDVKGFQFSLNYRYFRSYKHFRGKEEEENRVKEHTEVINHDNSVLLGVSYTFNKHWSVATTIPYMDIDRSSLYEHYGNPTQSNPTLNPRFHTQAKGFGDIRISTYYSAVQTHKVHLTVGLGFKLPTGNYNTKDYFHKKGSEGQDTLVYRVVDQSIQLGDGGFGTILEYDANYLFGTHFSAYATGLYMFNPRNTNGILRSATLTNNIPRSNEFSVCDQFLFRLGARYSFKNFQVAAGARYEGIPSEDVIGKSEGFRRPGYIISAEPSVGYTTHKHSFGINFPIALQRNRTQNTIDKERTKQTGTYTIGDAAFADWLISVSYAYKLSK